MSAPRLHNVDVPGDGNCGFYAFATGLIPILQRDILTGNQERLVKLEQAIARISAKDPRFTWDTLRDDIQGYYPPSKEHQKTSHPILTKFNRVLREILVTEQIESITKALKADSESDQENLHLTIMVNELIPLLQQELNKGDHHLFGELHNCMLRLCDKNKKDPTLFWSQFQLDIQEYKPGDLVKKQGIFNRFYRLLSGIKGTHAHKFIYDELVKTFNTLFINKLISQIKNDITNGSQTALKSIIETLFIDRNLPFTFETLERDIRQNNINMASKKLHQLLNTHDVSSFVKIYQCISVKYKPFASMSRLQSNDIFNEIFELLDYYIEPKPNPDILQTTFARNQISNDLVKAAAKHLKTNEEALALAEARISDLPEEVKPLDLTAEEQECLKRENDKEIFLRDQSRHIYLKRKLLESTSEAKENTLFPEDSILYQTINKKLKNGEWATQNDLVYLAVFFKISLLTYRNYDTKPKQNKTNDAFDTTRPTIRVRNHGNTHWLAVFDQDDQNQVTYDLVKSNNLDIKVAMLLSDDSQRSKLLSKTIAKLQRRKIPIETDFICDEKKTEINTANCENINKLSQLQLLNQTSYSVLKTNPTVFDEIKKLTAEEIDTYNQLLNAAHKKQIEFTGRDVEAMFTSRLGVERYIQVLCIREFIDQEKQKEKPGIDLRFWKSSFNDRMNPLMKLKQFLNGENPGFYDHEIATLRQLHSEFMKAFQIKMPRFELRASFGSSVRKSVG